MYLPTESCNWLVCTQVPHSMNCWGLRRIDIHSGHLQVCVEPFCASTVPNFDVRRCCCHLYVIYLTHIYVVLPKFSPELMQRTGTDRTEPKVRFSPVPVLQFWPQFSSRFWEFSKIPELFENRSKFMIEMQKNACKTAYVWCRKVIIHPICRKKAVIEFYQQGFRSFEWLVITKYGNSLSISCFLAWVPSKSIQKKKFKHELHLAISFKV